MSRRFLSLVVFVLVTDPSACRADDITKLYPDGANVAVGIDIKGIMNSQIGKKIIGEDKPFDAGRKMLKILFPYLEGVLPVQGETGRGVATVANKLERVTVLGFVGKGALGKDAWVAIYLEGEIHEEEYIKDAEAIASDKASKFKLEFKTEKLGDRKLLTLSEGAGTLYGLRVSKSLFVVVSEQKLIHEILDKKAGKKTPTIDQLLADRMKQVNPATSPIWLVMGELRDKDFVDASKSFRSGSSGLIAKFSMFEFNAYFDIENKCDTEGQTDDMQGLLGQWLPKHGVWEGIKVKVEGKTVTAFGLLPLAWLTKEYALQK